MAITKRPRNSSGGRKKRKRPITKSPSGRKAGARKKRQPARKGR